MRIKPPAVCGVLVGLCLLQVTQAEAAQPGSNAEADGVRYAAYEGEPGAASAPVPSAPMPSLAVAHASAVGEPAAENPPAASEDLGGAMEMSENPMEAAAQAWKIRQPAIFQRWGINMGGWVQQGITGNAANPADRFNGPLATNDRAGEYQLNQAWLYFVRPTKTDGYGTDLGGRVDVVYGTDWRFGMNRGLENRINSADNFYGLVMPQFYLEAAVNKLTVKMGHYATGMGYEMVPSVGNFFYSHNYLMSYSEPLLVTGAAADYQLNEEWTLVGAFHRGWMMFEDTNDGLDFLGGLRWKSEDKRTGLSMLVDAGDQTDFFGVDRYRIVYALVFTHQFNPKLAYALQHNYGWEQGGAIQPINNPGGDARWYGLCQWLTYTLTPKLALGGRFEWFRDNDGDRVAGVGGWIGSNRGWQGAPGFAGDFYECTVGLNWRPHSNFLLRPELRYDWYNGTRNLQNQFPFDDGARRDQFTFAVDLVTTF